MFGLKQVEKKPYQVWRDKMVVEIRRKRREDIFSTRRESFFGKSMFGMGQVSDAVSVVDLLRGFIQKTHGETSLEIICEGIAGIKALIKAEQILDIPDIQQILETEIIPIMLHFMDSKQPVKLQQHSSTCLSVIAETPHYPLIVMSGAIKPMIESLASKDETVQHEALLALGLMAQKDERIRKGLIQTQAIMHISSSLIDGEVRKEFMRDNCFLLLILCSYPELFSERNKEMIVKAFCTIIAQNYIDDLDILIWLLKTINIFFNPVDPPVMADNMLSKVMELCLKPGTDSGIISVTLEIMIMIAREELQLFDYLYSFDIWSLLRKTICSSEKQVVLLSCYLVTHFTMGSSEHIIKLLEQNFIIERMAGQEDEDILSQVCTVFSCLMKRTMNFNVEEVIMKLHLMPRFVRLMGSESDEVAGKAAFDIMTMFEGGFRNGADMKWLAVQFLKEGGMAKVERLYFEDKVDPSLLIPKVMDYFVELCIL